MPTSTTNYNLQKPQVNDPTDQDIWGGYLNSNFDIIDGIMRSASYSLTTALSANYSVVVGDINKAFLVNATSGNLVISLPPAATAGNGFKLTFVKTDASANTVTIDPDGSETINGATTLSLSSQYQTINLVCSGTSWFSNGAVASSDTGFIRQYAGVATAPTGYLLCDGAAVNRTTFSALFAVIGTAWGVGNGTTTFNVPDLRGQFLRGWSVDATVDPAGPRASGSTQSDDIKAHTHNIFPTAVNLSTSTGGGHFSVNNSLIGVSGSTGGGETRPKNKVVVYVIGV